MREGWKLIESKARLKNIIDNHVSQHLECKRITVISRVAPAHFTLEVIEDMETTLLAQRLEEQADANNCEWGADDGSIMVKWLERLQTKATTIAGA